ncbi:hypothetical protein FRE64_14530 [Euhalothece natronophila Z-M001]|uniref:Uncharacterized protein n=1 Tax=Euhalothece natronophila Z-M001 TaxID=522448 RepID=A0A5B8NRV9_9CHRO|nr:hypothetical protein [Euhalothece natronophila]QDZ41049.1 hypothetical protein FRE64_14530 [Euhalothece natronophila Z-M001]
MNVNSTNNVTRVTAKEIWETEDTTDLERVRSMTDEEIKEAIADDPDTFETDEEFWEDAVSCPPLTFVD